MLGELRRLYWKQLLKFGNDATKVRALRKMGVRIGERCRVYTTNFGSEPWLVRLGDHVCISNDVHFLTHSLNWPFQDKYDSLTGFGPIDVKDNVQIGVGAMILPNVTIGPDAVVGAGAVVTRDVPPNSVVAGNPAKVVCTLDEYEAKCAAKHIDIPKDRDAARKMLEERFWGNGR